MTGLLSSIRKRLSAKILIVLSLVVALVMAAVISLAAVSQRQHLQEQMTAFGRELQATAYAAIKLPMARGDSTAVEQQLREIRGLLDHTEIVVCDFRRQIVFATHAGRVGTSVTSFSGSTGLHRALTRYLATGQEPRAAFFEEQQDGRRYLLTMQGLNNQRECHHCHGSTRAVLGSLITRQSADATYSAIGSLRNRTIAISLLGLGGMVLLASFLLSRLVTRPVEELAAKTRRIADGNLDTAVAVHSDDAIGLLGQNFNSMVKSLKDQIGYFNSLRSSIAAPLFIVDTGMVITFMNEACARLIGYSREEVEGRRTCREVLRSDRCDTTCPIRYCLEDGSSVEGITATITSRDGRQIPVVTSASPLKDTRDTIIGAVLVCKDISDLLEAERLRYIQETAEREEEQRHYLEERARELRAVLSQAAGGRLETRAAVWDRGDVMDEIAGNINSTLDQLAKLYDRISSFNKELEQEVERRTRLLREKTVLLERANRELRELDQLKSAFLANMSHELRTPMNSIIGYTELLLDGVDGEVNDEQEKSLGKVRHNARHLLDLINDILDMAKIESGKLTLAPVWLDLPSLAASVAEVFAPAVAQKGLVLNLDPADDLPSVYADEEKVRQILLNLLSNAVKFTSQGSITLRIHRARSEAPAAEQAPRFVEVCVADTGIGIRARDLGKLFDKFSQLDSSTVRQYEGTGLGLSIARGLVVLHKGKIWAASTFGKGSTFCFTLPTDPALLVKTGRAAIEPRVAEVLAQYFERPVAPFLRPPRDDGKSLRCWEFTHCGQSSCPAFGNEERRCWLIPDTHCRGTNIATCSEKIDFCKSCEIIDRLLFSETIRQTETVSRLEATAGQAEDRPAVLVIDDNPEVIELLSKYVGEQYRVVGLTSGQEAVAKAMELRPAVITLDIMMPGKDGWQVLYDLKQHPATQDIPVVVISIVDNKKLGFSLGAAEYIVKPIDRDLLLHKLHSLEKIAIIKDILVIDSNTRSVALIQRLLDGSGYRSRGASTSSEALAAIENRLPDLIVLNPVMPEPDGLEVLERLKSDPLTKHIPLILLAQGILSEEDLARLNGRIQAILDKGLLSEEGLLQELAETIRRCNR